MENNNEETEAPAAQQSGSYVRNEEFIDDLTLALRTATAYLSCEVEDDHQFIQDVNTTAEEMSTPFTVVRWDAYRGLYYMPSRNVIREIGKNPTAHPKAAVDTLTEIIQLPANDTSSPLARDYPELLRNVIFLFRDFQFAWDARSMPGGPLQPQAVVAGLKNLVRHMENKSYTMMFFGSTVTVPGELKNYFSRVKCPLPQEDALASSFSHIHASARMNRPNLAPADDTTKQKAIDAAKGLTTDKARQAFTYALVGSNFEYTDSDYIRKVGSYRRAYIEEQGLVDIIEPRGGFERLGGLDIQKELIRQDISGLDKEARAYGVEKPNGLALMGPPGVGKTELVSCMADEFGLDVLMVRGDFLSKWQGESEKVFERILGLVRLYRDAGCILFIDELEKWFKSISGNSDSNGTGMRIAANFMKYLSSRLADPLDYAYIVGTLNNGEWLDEALMRDGRFDTKLWIGLPEDEAREQIFRIHLESAAIPRNPDDYDMAALVAASSQFTGSEIRKCVKTSINRQNWLGRDMANEPELLLRLVSQKTAAASKPDSAFEKQVKWAREAGYMEEYEDQKDLIIDSSTDHKNIDAGPVMTKVGETKITKKKTKK